MGIEQGPSKNLTPELFIKQPLPCRVYPSTTHHDSASDIQMARVRLGRICIGICWRKLSVAHFTGSGCSDHLTRREIKIEIKY